MRLFKGQIEVKETDVIKVHQDFLTVFDKNGNMTYFENDEYWSKREFDENGKDTYYEDSDEYWSKREYDKNGNVTYLKNSDEYWEKQEFDKNGNRIYYENSYGTIIDKRFKEMTVEEIEKQKKKYELLDLYRLLIELKEIVAFEVRLLDREKAIQDIQDISIRIYLIETELKGEKK